MSEERFIVKIHWGTKNLMKLDNFWNEILKVIIISRYVLSRRVITNINRGLWDQFWKKLYKIQSKGQRKFRGEISLNA